MSDVQGGLGKFLAKAGDCPACSRGAFAGAVIGWVLVVLTIVAGEWRQLALAAVLAASGLTALWLLHRVLRSLNAKSPIRRIDDEPAESSPVSAGVPEGADYWLRPQAGEDEAERFELTDLEWAVIQPVLARSKQGARRVDERKVMNGVLWRLRTGAAWGDLPTRYGSSKTCSGRFNQWRKDGVWRGVLEAIYRIYDGEVEMKASAAPAAPVTREPAPVVAEAEEIKKPRIALVSSRAA
jgi:hypothetical protein